MLGNVTESVMTRLKELNAIPEPQDLYSGSGADFYDRLVGPERTEVREVLALARKRGGAVLDIAAGSGRLTIPLVRSGIKVTAVDLSPDMLSRLRHALPNEPLLESVVADMCDFTLENRYDLAMIGATSITLLDRNDRFRLYANVQRHLSVGGVFACTIAGSIASESLSVTIDKFVEVEGKDGPEEYIFSQQSVDGGTARIINWVRVTELLRGGSVSILTSRLRVLSHETLSMELVEAGFRKPTVSQIRSKAKADILLLTTCIAEQREEKDDNVSK